MSESQDEVISTPELLELTLSHLPIRDLLLTAPLVCKTWLAITRTPALQRILFFEPDPSPRAACTHNPLLAQNVKDIKSMPWSRVPDAFNRPEASWRRMLVSQPPPQKTLVREIARWRGGVFERRAVVDGPLRMGALYDIILPLVDCRESAFCVRWHRDGDESDITLAAVYANPSLKPRIRVLDDEFYTVPIKLKNDLEFGKWGPCTVF
ncbi:putative f-box domain protein [Mycena sanguinolenta]|uniref:Putative f-box domain protein n=1 Tax=Mycena sanguinolenta TaxID=230812 RepID=A0A8H6Y7J8_9AGAR|nr:putative f-box domain protein [Mycena sanguinolenta]